MERAWAKLYKLKEVPFMNRIEKLREYIDEVLQNIKDVEVGA